MQGVGWGLCALGEGEMWKIEPLTQNAVVSKLHDAIAAVNKPNVDTKP